MPCGMLWYCKGVDFVTILQDYIEKEKAPTESVLSLFCRGFIINSMRKQSTGLFTVKSASTFEFRGSSPSALTTK